MDGLGNISDRMKATVTSYGKNDISGKKTSQGANSEGAGKAKPYIMLKHIPPPPTSGDTKNKTILNQIFLAAQLTVLAPYTAGYALTSVLTKVLLDRKEIPLNKAELIKIKGDFENIKKELEKELSPQPNAGTADAGAPPLNEKFIQLTQKQIKKLEKTIAKLDEKVQSLEKNEKNQTYKVLKGEEESVRKELYTARQAELKSEISKLQKEIQVLTANRALPSHIEAFKRLESNLQQQHQSVKSLATGMFLGKQLEAFHHDDIEVGIRKLEAEVPNLKARVEVEAQRDKVGQLVAEMESAPTMDQYRAKEAEAQAAREVLHEMERRLVK